VKLDRELRKEWIKHYTREFHQDPRDAKSGATMRSNAKMQAYNRRVMRQRRADRRSRQ